MHYNTQYATLKSMQGLPMQYLKTLKVKHWYLSGSELVTSGVCWTHLDSRSDVSTSETEPTNLL